VKRKNLFLTAAIVSISLSLASSSFGWSYSESDWSEEYSTCGGARQSPINIVTDDVVNGGDAGIRFNYKRSTSTNSGYAIKVTAPDGKFIRIGGEKFTLLQFHFHTRSEHTVNGVYYDMEMHLVHANDAYLNQEEGGELAVIGVFIKEGKKNKLLADLFNNLPEAAADSETPKKVEVLIRNYYNLLPDNKQVYTYPGSLTTPGCDEIVNWFVIAEPIEMSAAQINAYRELYDGERSNRPVQPLNGRIVTLADIDYDVPPLIEATYTSSGALTRDNNYTIEAGSSLELDFSAMNFDTGDNITITSSSLPFLTTSSTENGKATLYFNPDISDAGAGTKVYDLTVKASEGTNATSIDITITVTDEPVTIPTDAVPTLSEWGMVALGFSLIGFYRKRQLV